MATSHWQKSLEIPGCVLFSEGSGDLPILEVKTAWSTAEIYMHGAHITSFQKKNEPPVLFMSQLSRFNAGTPIRGGIPVIFPWFGPREGQPAHGFARIESWELREVSQLSNGGVKLRLYLPDTPAAAAYPKFAAEYIVTVGKTLAAELIIANESPDQNFTFENCLHTYFNVGEAAGISITGLRGAAYLDQMENFARKTEQGESIQISRETDRIYLDTTAAVEIHDPGLQRRIRIEKSGSLSTVVWNPWIEKSARMPDFGDDEFHKMVCVESGNVSDNRITLAPGKSATLRIELSTATL
jgi:D-hexose-6-phosphate mutarotase